MERTPCPTCEGEQTRRVWWTPWGGLIGPWLMGLVHCRFCGTRFVRRTGEPERLAVGRYLRFLLPAMACAVVMLVMGWAVVGRW